MSRVSSIKTNVFELSIRGLAQAAPRAHRVTSWLKLYRSTPFEANERQTHCAIWSKKWKIFSGWPSPAS